MKTSYLYKQEGKLDKAEYTIKFLYNDVPHFESVKELIEYALTAPHQRPTKKVGSGRYRPVQDIGSTRSIQDLYLLTKHYFPKATIFDVQTVLQSLLDRKMLNWHFCNTHGKMMFKKQAGASDFCSKQGLKNYGLIYKK